MLSKHLFFFSNHFVQVRVTMDPEPIYCIVTKGMTQQYTLDVTPVYCRAPCTCITLSLANPFTKVDSGRKPENPESML